MFDLGTAREKFIGILKDHYTRVRFLSDLDAYDKATTSVDLLAQGLDLDGEPYEYEESFASRVERVTGGFYIPTAGDRKKKFGPTRKIQRAIALPESGKNKESTTGIDDLEAAKERKQLLIEYPFLANRKDLESILDNYCLMAIKIRNLLKATVPNYIAIKNLSDSQIKYGQYLGISESERQKLKLSESKDNVASLSVQFQDTIRDWPAIVEHIKFHELRVLLQKYERKELSRTMFGLPAFAGMEPERAYLFVDENKEKYE